MNKFKVIVMIILTSCLLANEPGHIFKTEDHGGHFYYVTPDSVATDNYQWYELKKVIPTKYEYLVEKDGFRFTLRKYDKDCPDPKSDSLQVMFDLSFGKLMVYYCN